MFKRTQVEIVGVSSDPVDKQKEFVEKQKLTVSVRCYFFPVHDSPRMLQYPVLSDAKGEVRKAYHVGKRLFGLAETARITFIIDSKGTVR